MKNASLQVQTAQGTLEYPPVVPYPLHDLAAKGGSSVIIVILVVYMLRAFLKELTVFVRETARTVKYLERPVR
jgi:hypothetical protein